MNIRSITGTPRSPRAGAGRGYLWRRVGGFTLIELMIVVAIVAILARIAYPAYTGSIIKGKRAQGRAALLDLMIQQERYFSQSNSYLSFSTTATTATDAAGNSIPLPFKNFSGDNPSAAAYKLGSRTCNAPGGADLKACVEVFATPQFSDPLITELTIRSTGTKDCTVASGTKFVCWS